MFTSETMLYSLVLTTAVVVTFLMVFLRHRKHKKKRLPPGPFCWPFLGNFPQVLLQGNKPLFQVALDWRGRYGDVFQMKLGAARVIWICGLDMAHEVLVARGNKFDSRPNWMTVIRETKQNEGILFNSGETYRQMRQLLLNATTTDNGLGNEGHKMEDEILEEVVSCIQELEGIAERDRAVDLDSIIQTCFKNLLYARIFGKRVGCGDNIKRLKVWNEMIAEIKHLNKTFTMTDFFPCLSILPVNKTHSVLIEKLASMRKFIKEEISRHRKTFNLHSPYDLIDLYIESKKKGADISERNLLCLILDTFSADTSRELFLWLLALIINHQDVQACCREEIFKVKGHTIPVTSDDIQVLPYVRATIQEAIRLKGNPVAYPHATFKDVRLADYHIPKNSIILVNLSSIHLDPTLWKDPHQFRPERFIDTRGAFKLRDNFCPYGMGNRMCPLRQTSESTLFILFANLLRQFQFTPSDLKKKSDKLTGKQMSFHLPLTTEGICAKIIKVIDPNK